MTSDEVKNNQLGLTLASAIMDFKPSTVKRKNRCMTLPPDMIDSLEDIARQYKRHGNASLSNVSLIAEEAINDWMKKQQRQQRAMNKEQAAS
jgi:hypothetical protein